MTAMIDGLVETQKSLGICSLHLITGEDIIGHVFDTVDSQTGGEIYTVVKPVRPNVGMDQGPGGQPRFHVGLLPLMPYLGEVAEIPLPKLYVVYLVRVPAQMEKLYTEFTSSIKLASASDVPNLGIR